MSGGVSAEDVEARRYVYASVTFEQPLAWAKVLLPKMPAAEARVLAKRFAEEHVGRPATGPVHVYGANYIRDARKIQALGGVGYRDSSGQPLAKVPA